MIETLALTLTGLGLAASIFYYANVLQNVQKQRRYQQSLQLIDILREDGVSTWYTLYNLEWSDYDDFMARYGWENNPEMWTLISGHWQICHQFGHQVKLGLMDIGTFYDAGTGGFPLMWKKYKPIIMEMRRRNPSTPVQFRWWEYLIEEMEKESDRRGDNFYGLKQP